MVAKRIHSDIGSARATEQRGGSRGARGLHANPTRAGGAPQCCATTSIPSTSLLKLCKTNLALDDNDQVSETFLLHSPSL